MIDLPTRLISIWIPLKIFGNLSITVEILLQFTKYSVFKFSYRLSRFSVTSYGIRKTPSNSMRIFSRLSVQVFLRVSLSLPLPFKNTTTAFAGLPGGLAHGGPHPAVEQQHCLSFVAVFITDFRGQMLFWQVRGQVLRSSGLDFTQPITTQILIIYKCSEPFVEI